MLNPSVCFRYAAWSLTVLFLGIVPLGAAGGAPVLIEGDVPIERGFARQTVVRGLSHPWAVVWLPGGDLLVTERPGRLRRVAVAEAGGGHLDPRSSSYRYETEASLGFGERRRILNPDPHTAKVRTGTRRHPARPATGRSGRRAPDPRRSGNHQAMCNLFTKRSRRRYL